MLRVHLPMSKCPTKDRAFRNLSQKAENLNVILQHFGGQLNSGL